MTTPHYLVLAAICALLACAITLDAMLNTQAEWHTVGFFVFSICSIVLLCGAAWRFFA